MDITNRTAILERLRASTLLLLSLFASISHATLVTVGNGLVNDTDLNATWLQDGNSFYTLSGSGSNPIQATNLINAVIAAVPSVTDDTGVHSIATTDFDTVTGEMTWYGAEAWVGYLNSINYKGYSNWRQPIMTPVNGVSFNYNYSYDGTTDYGKNNTHINTIASELGHIFYNELGNLADASLTGGLQAGYGLSNTGPFIGMPSGVYWVGTAYPLWWGNAWHFHTYNGGQGNDPKSDFFYVWPVRTGLTTNTNLALNKPAAASSTAPTSAAAGAAVDGNIGSQWSSAATDLEWYQVDLGATYSINEITFIWGTHFGQSYDVQVSPDSVNWTTVITKTNAIGGADNFIHLQANGRYVRMHGLMSNGGAGYTLREVEVYGVPFSGIAVTNPGPQNTAIQTAVSLQINAQDSNVNPLALSFSATGLPNGLSINSATGLISGSVTTIPNPNPATVDVVASNANGSNHATFSWTFTSPVNNTNRALNHPATASSQEANTLAPAAAVDGNATTRWSSLYSDNEWFQVDLGATYSISRVKLVWEAAYGSQYEIQVSSNGTTWAPIYNQLAGVGGTEDHTGLVGTGRYIRMQGKKRGTPWGYSLYEMEVYGSPAAGVAINNPGAQSSAQGSSVSLQITATDSSNPPLPLTYSITGQPSGLSIGQTTGLISGSPTVLGLSPNVQVTASNANGSATATFSWNIVSGGTASNLALQKTAAASSVETNSLLAANSVDGSLSTRWASGYNDNEWLQVDLGASYNINRVKLVWEAAFGSQYQIQVSDDGATWHSIFSQANGAGGTEDLTNLIGTGRYVRMQGLKRATPWGYSLYEMEVYGTLASPVTVISPGAQSSVQGSSVSLQITATDSSASPLPLTYGISGQPAGLSISQSTGVISGTPTALGTSPSVTVTASNAHGSASTTFSWTIGSSAPPPAILLSSQKTATASSVETNALVAGNAFDGNLTTRWSSGYTNTEWLQVDLGASHTISRVRLVWEAAYGSQYQIQVSNDGLSWTPIFTRSNGTGGTEDLTSLSGTGRYVRMQGVQRGTPWGYSLYEMEVYGN